MKLTLSDLNVSSGIVFPFLVAGLAASCTCGADETADVLQSGEQPLAAGNATDDVVALRARVQRLIEQERYDEASSVAESASDPELERLWEQASEERRARDMLEEACMEIDGKNLAAVHEACIEIEGTSRYRDKGCCSGAAERLGEDRLRVTLDEAETDGYERATKSALALAADNTMPEHVREQAKAIAEDLENLPDSEVEDDGGGFGNSWRRRVRRRSKRSGSDDEELSTAQESFSAGAIRQARTALRRGNAQGCISALRGAPRSADVISLLITCYARTGQLGSACGVASRNPNVEYAQQFRKRRCR